MRKDPDELPDFHDQRRGIMKSMMTEDSEDPRRIASLLRHPLAGGGMSSPSFGHHTLQYPGF